MVHRRRIAGDISPATHVTTLELFFDLVFVFTITQVTRLLEPDLTPAEPSGPCSCSGSCGGCTAATPG